MKPTSFSGNAAAIVLASGMALAIAGCGSDTRKADAAMARADREPLVSGEGSAAHLYASRDQDSPQGDERISRARSATARTSAGEIELSVMSLTLPAEEEMLLLEARGPVEARPNQPFEYEIDVTNVSDRALANIQIREHSSGNLEFLGSDPESGMIDGEVHGWTIDHLAPGETETILINAQAAEAGSADLCLTASMTPLICLTTQVVRPELELIKIGPAEILRCEPIEYTLTVRNTGVGAARNVRIIDDLPEGLTHGGDQRIEIDVGTLKAGESREFPVIVEATSTGEFTNQAQVTADGGLTQEAEYTIAVHEPRLEITTNGPTKDFIGAPLDYEITVTNVGDAAARDTVLSESLPDRSDFESATLDGRESGDRVAWDLGTLSPGESKTVSVRMRVDREGPFISTATATAYCAEDVRAEMRTTLTGIPGLLIEVKDNEDPVRIGSETTYEIKVTNQGSKVANAVQIKAILDPSVEFVSAAGETAHRALDSDQIVFEPVRALEPGDTATWHVTVRGASPADSRFEVEMTSTELEEPVNEEESTTIYEGE